MILALLWITPQILVVVVAMKRPEEFLIKKLLSLPEGVSPLFANIIEMWKLTSLGQGFLNSLIYASGGAALAVFVASLAGYSLTKLKVKGKFVLFIIIYSGTIFPFQIYLIPLFRMYVSFGLYDTRAGMVLLYTAICIPFCLFVFRNYFTTISNGIIEAAALDGARPFRVYCSIVVPLSKAPMLSLFLFQFTWIWNDMLFGLVLSKSENVRPIMASLMMLSGLFGRGSTPQIMAGSFIASLPTLILFLLLQRYFMSGLKLTAVGE